MRGEPGELDFRAWRAAAEYEGGFGDAHPAVETFWRVAQGPAPETKTKALVFRYRVRPRARRGSRLANVPLCVQRCRRGLEFGCPPRTPASTLLLPEYATEEKMRGES